MGIPLRHQHQRKLKKLGLASQLFMADKHEEYERALTIYKNMQQRIEELENSEEWRDKDLPWRAAREQYKSEDHSNDGDPGPEIMQSETPVWLALMGDWILHSNDGFHPIAKQLRRAKNYNSTHKNNVIRERCAQKGIDYDEFVKYHAEKRKEQPL